MILKCRKGCRHDDVCKGRVPVKRCGQSPLMLTLNPLTPKRIALQVGSQHRRFAEPAGQVQDGKWVVRGSDPAATLRFEANGGKVRCPKQGCRACQAPHSVVC